MDYFSTGRSSPPVSFRAAVSLGQPSDGGLFFPSHIPTLRPDFASTIKDRSNEEIAFEMLRPYVNGEIPDESLHGICAESIDFPFPLVPVTPEISALEL